ncbi:hypothetical protein F7725_023729 [Dissostichus mawsoni]|uniref:Uncharacterized protein n=1 Tax=Dissostichus mawsoni TaxID=36200 RepID=A0A7J5Y084_DISMA|nr:hypothetical protein F7725_023729 [Dissostichus mawsoni]
MLQRPRLIFSRLSTNVSNPERLEGKNGLENKSMKSFISRNRFIQEEKKSSDCSCPSMPASHLSRSAQLCVNSSALLASNRHLALVCVVDSRSSHIFTRDASFSCTMAPPLLVGLQLGHEGLVFQPFAVQVPGLVVRHVLSRQHLLSTFSWMRSALMLPSATRRRPVSITPLIFSSLASSVVMKSSCFLMAASAPSSVVGISVYLVVEEGLGLLGVPEEQLVGVALGQQVLPVLPHLVQLVPAGVERLQPLPQEHVLRVRLALRHHLAHVPHLLVVLLVVADLVLDVLVLSQQLLGLGQRVGHVLGGDGCLRAGQPGLEVVHVAQELLQLAGLAQGLLATLVMPSRRPLMASDCSGCSEASRSASFPRSLSLSSMAARSLSIPVSFLCSAMTPARSFPSSWVDSINCSRTGGGGGGGVIVLDAQSRAQAVLLQIHQVPERAPPAGTDRQRHHHQYELKLLSVCGK